MAGRAIAPRGSEWRREPLGLAGVGGRLQEDLALGSASTRVANHQGVTQIRSPGGLGVRMPEGPALTNAGREE